MVVRAVSLLAMRAAHFCTRRTTAFAASLQTRRKGVLIPIESIKIPTTKDPSMLPLRHTLLLMHQIRRDARVGSVDSINQLFQTLVDTSTSEQLPLLFDCCIEALGRNEVSFGIDFYNRFISHVEPLSSNLGVMLDLTKHSPDLCKLFWESLITFNHLEDKNISIILRHLVRIGNLEMAIFIYKSIIGGKNSHSPETIQMAYITMIAFYAQNNLLSHALNIYTEAIKKAKPHHSMLESVVGLLLRGSYVAHAIAFTNQQLLLQIYQNVPIPASFYLEFYGKYQQKLEREAILDLDQLPELKNLDLEKLLNAAIMWHCANTSDNEYAEIALCKLWDLGLTLCYKAESSLIELYKSKQTFDKTKALVFLEELKAKRRLQEYSESEIDVFHSDLLEIIKSKTTL